MIKHTVWRSFINPEDELAGYDPATLYTTRNGLDLILAALKDYWPEPWETNLLNALIQALEKADIPVENHS